MSFKFSLSNFTFLRGQRNMVEHNKEREGTLEMMNICELLSLLSEVMSYKRAGF